MANRKTVAFAASATLLTIAPATAGVPPRAVPAAAIVMRQGALGMEIQRIASERKASRRGGLRRTGLPLPRFASLRSDKVNLRAGPGVRYPVEWVYLRRGLPVMITAEFDAWRKIRDWHGTVGWIHRSLLSGRRTVITTARELVLRREPSRESAAVGRAETGVIARLLSCADRWCQIEAGGISGWARRAAFWGTLPKEKIN